MVMVPESVPLLEDAVMDYVELNKGDFRFIFSNPGCQLLASHRRVMQWRISMADNRDKRQYVRTPLRTTILLTHDSLAKFW